MSAAVTLPAPRVVSHSELTVARRCPREHHHMYVARRRPRAEGEALFFGKKMHTSLQLYYEQNQAWLDGVRDDPKAVAMLLGHAARWDRSAWKILAVEEEFRFTVEDGTEVFGRVDLRIQDQEGREWIVDHKTTSSEVGAIAERAQVLDMQTSLYLMAYPNAAGMIFNILRKPLIRLKKGETEQEFAARCLEDVKAKPEYFHREPVVRFRAELDRARTDVRQLLRVIDNDYRNTDQCFRFNSACPYLGVCRGDVSLDDETLFETKETR